MEIRSLLLIGCSLFLELLDASRLAVESDGVRLKECDPEKENGVTAFESSALQLGSSSLFSPTKNCSYLDGCSEVTCALVLYDLASTRIT
jgi:hypothetical protein